LIYHCRHFHCRSDRSDGVILAPSVGTIARPSRTKTGSSDVYYQQVNDRCGSVNDRKAWPTRIHILPTGPKVAFGQLTGKFSMSVELPQLPRPSNHHYFRHLKPKSCCRCLMTGNSSWGYPGHLFAGHRHMQNSMVNAETTIYTSSVRWNSVGVPTSSLG
jgi:hypothetical protein